MSLLGDLRAGVMAQPALTALFGPAPDTRFWRGYAPADASGLYAVAMLPGGEGHKHQGGAAEIRSPLLQVTVYGPSWAEVDAGAAALRAYLHGLRGLLGGTYVRTITCAEPVDASTWERDGDEAPRPAARLEAQVWYV